MRPLLLLLALLVPLAGCQQGVQLPIVPGPGPGPVGPVLPPDPVEPIDPVPTNPGATPEFPRSALDQLTTGMTAEQVAEAIGSAPIQIPQGEGPPTVRWEVNVDGTLHILYVVFDDAGRLRDKGLAEVVTIPNAP